MIAFGVSDKGKLREHNEDVIFVSNKKIGNLSNLYIVADGVGGKTHGRVASSFATEKFCEFVSENNHYTEPSDVLLKGIQEINKYIHHKSKENYEYQGMATTFLAVTIKEGKIYVANVGDSRMYLLDDRNIKQVTHDNSYYNEFKNILENGQSLCKANAISRAVGEYSEVRINSYEIKTHNKYSHILLCSDGLSKMLHEKEIQKVVKESSSTSICASRLVDMANKKGGDDNISVIVIG